LTIIFKDDNFHLKNPDNFKQESSQLKTENLFNHEKKFVKVTLENINSFENESSSNERIIDQIKQKKVPISSEDETKNQGIYALPNNLNKKIGCSCKMQKCINFKCSCFKKNIFCYNCDCVNCGNSLSLKVPNLHDEENSPLESRQWCKKVDINKNYNLIYYFYI